MKNIFKRIFKDKDVYKGDKVSLKERFYIPNEKAYDGVGTVFFDIYNLEGYRVGTIDLRFKMDDFMLYYGHVGYDIYKAYRGNHYALEACKVLFKIAKDKYKMTRIIITCNPDNIASYKTLIKLGGVCEGIKDVPVIHPLYKHGDKQKYIFRYNI